MGRSTGSSARKRPQDDKAKQSNGGAKKSKIEPNAVTNGGAIPQKKISHVSHTKIPGCVLTMGEGDTGQLGLGPDVMEKVRPAKVDLPKDNVVQVYAGGMHTVCLTSAGEVYTFGCNDEGALGRQAADEDECMVPGRVDMAEHIVQISAGDSHTAFLTEDGRVFACGTFRDANGPIGLVSGNKIEKTPVEVLPDQVVLKIDSGTDHLVCLTDRGEIFTLGCADQGQLGRVAECFAVRGGRKGIGFLLIPGQVHVRKRGAHFCDVWTGQYTTYAQEEKTGIIYAWGLNNYYQIGFADMVNRFMPSISPSFSKSLGWRQISGGQHHAIALDKSGDVYALGRKEYGRLGVGKENLEEKSEPCVITSLQGKKCSSVNSGTAVSFAVLEDGKIYAWGMGSTRQLGQMEEDDIYEPQQVLGKQLEQRKGLMVSAGGQHTVILAIDRSIGDN